MYAIVYKSDGFPICRQVAGVSPDPVVTWNTEAAAQAFISANPGVAYETVIGVADAVRKTSDGKEVLFDAVNFKVHK